MVRDYLSYVSPSPQPRIMRSTRSLTLTELESVRLSSINSRSTCINFHFMRQLPSTQDLLNICPSYTAQSVVVGPRQQLWCFLVFLTVWDRERAEKQLDCSNYMGGEVRVDWRKRIVPMAEDDLERSRQWTCLAVHGISPETNKRDLETSFPGSVSVTIARRGGSAFLQFREREEAEREFRRAEWVTVRGCRVEVMFGHSLHSLRRRGAVGDLRGKIRVKRVVRDSEMKMKLSQIREGWEGRDIASGYVDRRWVEQNRSRSRSRSERWSRPVKKSRSRSKIRILGRRKSRSDIILTMNNIQKHGRRWINNYAESNMELEEVDNKLREDVDLVRGDLEDCKTSLAQVLTSSPYKVENLTPVSVNRSSSICLSPSPILCSFSSTKPQAKSDKSKQTRMRSKPGDSSSCLSNNSRGDFGPLYRELVTQLVGVGLSGKLAHGRAADIVNVWADTGYKVEQLREVLGRFKGREEQRKELSRIVKEKCRKKARKMKIDIGAMVDITIAYLLDTGAKQDVCNDNSPDKPEFLQLSRYLEMELASLGMKRMSVEKEVAKVIEILSELSLSLGQMEAEYTFMVGDSQMGGLAGFHTDLEKKLAETGFLSKYLSARLAAGLIMEFYQGKDEVRMVVEKNKELFENVDNALRVVSDLSSKSSPISALSSQTLKSIKPIPLGYPRMVVVLAIRLFNMCRMSEDECKMLARSMVGVWVNYRFDYMEMRNMYEKEMIGVNKEKDNISLMGMRRLLHCRLRAKVDQGYTKPKSFGFSKLIDLTIFYFENAS